MPLLSIVIPVYNVENYLDECLRSILNQNFNDYELILVDDASTDRSGEICDEYASKYKNIKVIHLKENSLLPGARNAGLEKAEGEYVHFCDSDDYYLDNSLLPISKILKKDAPDVLVGQFICKPEKGARICSDIKFDPYIFENANPDTIVEYFLKLPGFIPTNCRYIINRQFLVRNNLKYLEGYILEDEEWSTKIVCSANKFSLYSEPFYCYRTRSSGSITSKETYLHAKARIVIAIKLLGFLKEKKYQGVRKEYIISRVKVLLELFEKRCDTLDRNQIHELSQIIEKEIESFNTLSEISKTGDLFDFVNRYGTYMGLCLYRTYHIERALEIVHGKENKKIYVFPAGYDGETTARILKNAGYNVIGLLDNADTKNGSIIEGLPVSLPMALGNIPDNELSEIFVLIATQKRDTEKILKEQLRDLGLKDSQFASRIY